MNLRDQLDSDMKEAMKARERVRLQTVRAVRGAVRNKEIETGDSLDDDGILRVIRTLVKQRVEAIEQYRAGGRDELAEQEIEEKAVLEAYLPAAPSAEEVERVVREVIAEVGAAGPQDMGKVMGPALGRLGPAADGKLVSGLVRDLLRETPS
jgi:hypothetical protein